MFCRAFVAVMQELTLVRYNRAIQSVKLVQISQEKVSFWSKKVIYTKLFSFFEDIYAPFFPQKVTMAIFRQKSLRHLKTFDVPTLPLGLLTRFYLYNCYLYNCYFYVYN